ncbi:host specificity factor TipJ family phage tail protein [Inquilinus sp. YAF38]|uniref:host specificity factor TipJ family phage tail protein n=1 Tax=Inquilinus sp. YAF38 TaxID=3233084 RepID=UPI003F90244D
MPLDGIEPTICRTTPLGPIAHFELAEPVTIAGWLERHPIDPRIPVVCLRNDVPVLRADWSTTLIEPTDRVAFVELPGDGGGGSAGIFRIVAMLALAVAAPYLAPVIAGVGATAATLSLVTAGITLVGGVLINMILPPATPKSPGGAGGLPAASPTYSLQAQGNQARLDQPIPELFGRHIIVPDFAAPPWADFQDNEQFLYQLFSLGIGRYQHHEVLIANTSLWREDGGLTGNFVGVELQFIPPGGKVKWPFNVVTSAEVTGQSLRHLRSGGHVDIHAGDRSIRFRDGDGPFDQDKSQGAEGFIVGDRVIVTGSALNSGTFTIVSISPDDKTVIVAEPVADETDVEIEIVLEGWVGPFAASGPGQICNRLAFDIVFPQGLFEADEKDGDIGEQSVTFECQARQIDDLGNPIGGWVTLGEPFVERATVDPQRLTIPFDVADGRYQGRMRRTSKNSNDTNVRDSSVWGGLRAYIVGEQTYPDTSLLAVKIKATDQLSEQSSRQFRVIQTRMLQIWTGSGWTEEQPTRSIAWAATYMLRNGRSGAGVPDSRIDLPAFVALDQVWAQRGDTFDGVFDTERSFEDALTALLRVGRAQHVNLGGIVTVTRDRPQSIAKAVFTPRSIVRGTLEVTYKLWDPESPDDVIVEYVDEQVWTDQEVRCVLPGSASVKPARMSLFGCAKRPQAFREGVYQAAVNARRRIFAKFQAEMEGRLLQRGDLVIINHDMPQWGYGGDVMGFDPATLALDLAEPIGWVKGAQHWMALRRPNGGEWGPVKIARGEYDDQAIVDRADHDLVAAQQGASLATIIRLDPDAVATQWVAGPGKEFIKRFLLISARPIDLTHAELQLQIEDEYVHVAELGLPVPPMPPILPLSPDAPEMRDLRIAQDPNSLDPILHLSWAVTPGAANYIIQTSRDTIAWSTVYAGGANRVTLRPEAGMLYIRGAAVGTFRGPWTAPIGGVYGQPQILPAVVSGLALETRYAAGSARLRFNPAPRAASYQVSLYVEDATPGVFDKLALALSTPLPPLTISAGDVQPVGGPWRRFEIRVVGVNEAGQSPTPAVLRVLDPAPEPPADITVTPQLNGRMKVSWDAVTEPDFKSYAVYRGSSADFTPLPSSLVYEGTATQVEVDAPPAGQTHYVRIEARDLFPGDYLISAGIPLTTAQQPPPAPENPELTNAYSSPDLVFQWAPSTGATEYQIAVRPSGQATAVRTYRSLYNGWTYTADLIAADGGPWPALKLDIRAKNGAGLSPATTLALP